MADVLLIKPKTFETLERSQGLFKKIGGRDITVAASQLPSSLPAKNISLSPSGKSFLEIRVSWPDPEGRFAIVTKRWVWDAVDAAVERRAAGSHTAKPRGPDVSTLASGDHARA